MNGGDVDLEGKKATLSDLFFHHQHPHIEEMHHEWVSRYEEAPPTDVFRCAVYREAACFLEDFGEVVALYLPEMEVSAEYLTSDYLGRL